MTTTKKARVIGYARVSTDMQAEDGVSLAAQSAKLEAYAVAMDLELVRIEVDAGASARTMARRPALNAALASLEAGGADGLLICKLDRLTRSIRDLCKMVDSYFAERFALLSITDSLDTRTASGRLVMNMLVAVAQWESETTGERVSEALQHVKREGATLGAPALGWERIDDVDEHGRQLVVPVADECATLDRMHELYCTGASLRAIAANLTAEGYKTKRGGKWHASTVRAALKRAATQRAA